MNARWIGLIIASTLAACARETPTSQVTAEHSFSVAKEQAFALGEVLAGTRACEGDAWEAPFHEFMAAKRKQGFNGEQTAMIAALVGGAGAGAGPEMLECSARGQARRTAALDQTRAAW